MNILLVDRNDPDVRWDLDAMSHDELAARVLALACLVEAMTAAAIGSPVGPAAEDVEVVRVIQALYRAKAAVH